MQRFHGTSPQQLVLVGDRPETAFMFAPSRRPAARLRLAEKDKYAELTLRRRRAQIAARRLLRGDDQWSAGSAGPAESRD